MSLSNPTTAPAKPRAGRPRSFDREQALDAADACLLATGL